MTKDNYYDTQLSHIHHQDFGQLAKKAAEVILQLIGQEQWKNARVIDLGCGSGITAAVLSQQGHDVTGVDYSGAMISLARKNAPRAKFVQTSLFDFDLPACDLVSAIGEPLNYLFDNRSNAGEIRSLFQNVFKAISPGGYFVFDLLAPGTLGADNPQKKIIETEEYSMFLQVAEDTEQNLLTREITVFFRQGELYRRSQEIHRQQLYEPAFVVQVLEETGFKVTISRHYSDYALREGHYAYICHRPSA